MGLKGILKVSCTPDGKIIDSFCSLSKVSKIDQKSLFLILRSRTIDFGLDSSYHPFVLASKLEVGKLSRVHLPSDFHEIWFQCRKYIGPRPVEVHFAKFTFWGVQGSKNAEIFATFTELEIGKLS